MHLALLRDRVDLRLDQLDHLIAVEDLEGALVDDSEESAKAMEEAEAHPGGAAVDDPPPLGERNEGADLGRSEEAHWLVQLEGQLQEVVILAEPAGEILVVAL